MKIQLNARNRTHQFDGAPADKILCAGLSSGIALPYECGSGTCGTCKARLLSGRIDNCWPEAPGKKVLKAADEFLMCQCVAQTDISIEVAGFVPDFAPSVCVPAACKGQIRQTAMLTHDVMRVDVEVESPMEFDAGQFALIAVEGVAGYRGWSMVNFEPSAATLRFVVKKKPGGGMSEWLFSQPRLGADVEVYGPLGSATYDPSVAKDLLFIAGGTGIAGMMSILERAARAQHFQDHNGDVFFGVRSMRDAFFLDAFSGLRERCGSRLNVTIVLSEEPASPADQAQYPMLKFDTGFVHEAAGRQMQGRYQGVRAYLAGPSPAVDACVRMLLMARVSTDNIRYDKFS